MTKIIISLGESFFFIGFAIVMLCGIFSLVYNIKSVFKKEKHNTDDDKQ